MKSSKSAVEEAIERQERLFQNPMMEAIERQERLFQNPMMEAIEQRQRLFKDPLASALVAHGWPGVSEDGAVEAFASLTPAELKEVESEVVEQVERRWGASSSLASVPDAPPAPGTTSSQPTMEPHAGANAVFEFVELLAPKQYCDEEFGDAHEEINALVSAGASNWRVWVKIVSTIFWFSINVVIRRCVAALKGKPAR